MKSILIVISTLNTGGAQRAVSNIVCNMSEDIDIDILLNDSDDIKYPYRGNIIDLGMKPVADKTSLLYQIKAFFVRYKKLKELKKTGKYDACISFLDSANFVNVLTGNKYCKTIVSVRAHMTQMCLNSNKYKYIVAPLVKLLYNHADKVVAVAKGTAYDLAVNYNIKSEKIVTIYNGYDVKSIQNKANALEVAKDNDNFVITTMGRLDEQKGQWHLIKAFYEFRKKYPNSKLVLLGDGILRDELVKMTHSLGLAGDVEFAGFKENPFAVVAHSDLFVFPSLFEGFPNALVEAMACQVPVIAADCESGVREILAPSTDFNNRLTEESDTIIEYAPYGIIVPCGAGWDGDVTKLSDELVLDTSEQALLDAMCAMYEDAELRDEYSKASLDRVLELSIKEVCKEWECIV